jgi:hypothetical protein
MSADDDKKKKRVEDDTGESGETGASGQGGKSGQIAFVDFLASTESKRTDLLPDEVKRKLSTHDQWVEAHVKKQKDKKDSYNAVKDKKVTLAAHREGLRGGGSGTECRNHPILSDKAQFSGIDRQVNNLPNENVADTNEANRDELKNQYRLQYAPGMQPRPGFNPQPKP